MTTRVLRVEIDQSSWPNPQALPPRLRTLGTSQHSVNILEVLVQIARCTAPPTGHGFDLSACWAWLRYYPALDSGPELRLREEWAELDPHQKTILSDDFGMGLPCALLTKALDLRLLLPTNYAISRLQMVGPGRLKLRSKSNRGPRKSPDFIGIDSGGLLHVIECKGTQAANRLSRALSDGKVQKRNLVVLPAALRGESLVAGLYVPQHDGRAACCRLVDPEPNEESDELTFEEGEPERFAWHAEVASALNLMGAPIAGNALATGEWSSGAREALSRTAAKWERASAFERAIRVARREIVFPRPLDKLDATRAVGIRATIGVEESVLNELAVLGEPLSSHDAMVRRERERTASHTDHAYETLTSGGTYAKLDLLTEPP